MLDGWKGGWMDGWMGGKAGLRIAYSNQKLEISPKMEQACITNTELLLKSGKTLLVHAHQLKPYFLPRKSNTTFHEREKIETKEEISPVPTQTDEPENE